MHSLIIAFALYYHCGIIIGIIIRVVIENLRFEVQGYIFFILDFSSIMVYTVQLC